MIVAPGLGQAGSVVKVPVSHVDLFPTLADLCGVKTPKNLQGQSLVPMLKDADAQGRGWALTQVVRGGGFNRFGASPSVGDDGNRFFGFSLRTPKWRYTEWDEGRRGVELYDHEADPREITNLAKDPKYADVVKELSTQLQAAAKATYPASGEIPALNPGLWSPNITDP